MAAESRSAFTLLTESARLILFEKSHRTAAALFFAAARLWGMSRYFALIAARRWQLYAHCCEAMRYMGKICA